MDAPVSEESEFFKEKRRYLLHCHVTHKILIANNLLKYAKIFPDGFDEVLTKAIKRRSDAVIHPNTFLYSFLDCCVWQVMMERIVEHEAEMKKRWLKFKQWIEEGGLEKILQTYE